MNIPPKLCRRFNNFEEIESNLGRVESWDRVRTMLSIYWRQPAIIAKREEDEEKMSFFNKRQIVIEEVTEDHDFK